MFVYSNPMPVFVEFNNKSILGKSSFFLHSCVDHSSFDRDHKMIEWTHFARIINYRNIASSIQSKKSKERIRTVESKATTRPKVDVVGEKVQSVVVAFGLDRLPQKFAALIALV